MVQRELKIDINNKEEASVPFGPMFSAIGVQYDLSNMEHPTVGPTDSFRAKLVDAVDLLNGWNGKVSPRKIV